MAKNKKIDDLHIIDEMDSFTGTTDEAAVLENEYALFVLGTEKFRTVTYLREIFYGKKATTGRIQRVYHSSKQT